MQRFRIAIGLAFLLFFQLEAGLSVEQILSKVADQHDLGDAKSEMKVELIRPRWSKTMKLKTWTKGETYAMAYLLAPVKDSGTVFLKNTTGVYNYLPKIKKTIKMPQQLLAQKWMGSDMSVDDLVKVSDFQAQYTASLRGKESVAGRNTYAIDLLPRAQADVIWGKIQLWIDQQTFTVWKAVYYDEDLQAVQQLQGAKLRAFGSKMLVSSYTYSPLGKKGNKTIVTTEKLWLNQNFETDFFTKERMKKLKP